MSAVITRLGRDAIHSGRDIAEDIVSFSLPENVSIEEFKSSIGSDIVADYNVLFFDHLPDNSGQDTHGNFIPGRPFKMSIWANNDSNLTGTKPAKHSDESQ
jgi:hypothetical protein